MLRFFSLLILLFYLCLTHYCSAQRYTLSYDNIPITAKTWEQINIKWHGGYAKLLRPIKYAHQYGFVVGAHSRIDLAEFGVPNANVRVMAVKPLSRQPANRIDHLPKDEKPIIGVYFHQTNDVRKYAFKNAHGKISVIHATPIHPFYVKNLEVYLPISKVTSAMQLIGKNN